MKHTRIHLESTWSPPGAHLNTNYLLECYYLYIYSEKKKCNWQELNPRPEEQIKQCSNQLCHNSISEYMPLLLDIAIFGTRPASCQIGQRWFKRCHAASFLPTTTTCYPPPVVSSLPPPPVTAHRHLWRPGTFPPPPIRVRSRIGCRTPTPAIESTNASSTQPPDPR